MNFYSVKCELAVNIRVTDFKPMHDTECNAVINSY